MLSEKLLKKIPAILEEAGPCWELSFIAPVRPILTNADELFLGNIMNTYDATANLGTEIHDTLLKHKIKINALKSDLVLSLLYPAKVPIGVVIVAQKLTEGLYACTAWLGLKKNYTVWAPAPAIAILSLPQPLSECGKLNTLKSIISQRHIKQLQGMDRLYGIIPLFELSGNLEQDSHDLDWLDSGMDALLRTLVMLDNGAERRKEGKNKYYELFIKNIKIGTDPLEPFETNHEDYGVDIITNVVGLSDHIDKYM
jgi:hypothetical protein